MRHRLKGKKLNRRSEHRMAMLRNIAVSLIENKTVKSTLPKCKTIRPFIEKLTTIAKKNTLHARRLLLSRLGQSRTEAVNELIKMASGDYKDRPGGYTRILKSGFRYGDNAPMAVIQFVGHEHQVKKQSTQKSK